LYSSAFKPEENEKSLNDWKSLTRLFEVEITYVDEEMDSIRFSSDEELIDALLQFSKLKPDTSNSSVVLRCKAIVEERKLKGKKSKKSNDAGTNGKDTPELSDQASRDRSLECPNYSADCSSSRNLSGFDREFVHARHTCDGCGRAPIIGLRYHALNIPDYDYCETCMANYHGAEVTFQLEQLGKCYTNVCRSTFTTYSSVRSDILLWFCLCYFNSEACDERFQKVTNGNHCKVGNFLEVLQLSKSVEGSEAFLTQEATHKKNKSEPAERKKVGLQTFHDSENVAKAFDVIGMGIIQSACIISSVLSDIMEISKKTQDTPNNAVPNTGTASFEDEEVKDKLEDVSYSGDVNESPSLSVETSPCLSTDVVGHTKQENCLEVKHKTDLKEQECSIVEYSTEDEWNMVENGEDTLVTIGSALYREDLIRSTEELYASKEENAEPELKGNECISGVHPSFESKSRDIEGLSCTVDVQQLHNPVLLARWDKELDELRQMGFIDDQKSLEALEILEAAEIGVNSEKGITVAMAVNWLLNNTENS
jgi:hypothetical protein